MRSDLANALLMQGMATQNTQSPGIHTAASTLAQAMIAKNLIEKQEMMERDALDKNRIDVMNALSAYRNDRPYTPAPSEVFDDSDILPGGLKTLGTGQNVNAMAQALAGAHSPELQNIGFSQLTPKPDKFTSVDVGVPGNTNLRQRLAFSENDPQKTFNLGAPFEQKPMVNIDQRSGPTTPGSKKVDEKFAEDYVEWKLAGGFAEVQKGMSTISRAIEQLESGDVQTGSATAFLGDTIQTIANPDLVALRQNVEGVVQKNLKSILGHQFTEAEGERLIERAFNPKLKPGENIHRLKAIFLQMSLAAKAKQEAVDYFEKNKTMEGFTGVTYSKADFTPEAVFKEGGRSKDDPAKNKNDSKTQPQAQSKTQPQPQTQPANITPDEELELERLRKRYGR